MREIEAALFLFDNDEEKARIFVSMLKGEPWTLPQNFRARMDFSEPSCRWCDNGECWFFIPDSRLRCEHRRKPCTFYERKEGTKDETAI